MPVLGKNDQSMRRVLKDPAMTAKLAAAFAPLHHFQAQLSASTKQLRDLTSALTPISGLGKGIAASLPRLDIAALFPDTPSLEWLKASYYPTTTLPDMDWLPSTSTGDDDPVVHSRYVEQLSDGGFTSNGRILEGISTDSQDGRLFSLFLTNPNRFVSDVKFAKDVHTPDSEQRAIGFVVRNLKQKLSKLGFTATIERRKQKKGYALVDLRLESESVVAPLVGHQLDVIS